MSRPNLCPPPHATTRSQSPGAAQFLSNLTPNQLQHLQLTIPTAHIRTRFSQFLEGPRRTPVPQRFHFEALDAEARKARHAGGRLDSKAEKKGHGRWGSLKSHKNRPENPSLTTIKEDCGEQTKESSKSSFESKGVKTKSSEPKAVVEWRFYATGICLCLLNLVAAWDATALSLALPVLSISLDGSALDAFWLGISFLLAATITVPWYSAFADIFGRKAMLLTGVTFFTAGSFIAAVSGNFLGLHLGRVLQGIGAGGICLISDFIVADLVKESERRKWSTLIASTWALGAITGPMIGEALAKNGHFRWLFWINMPIGASTLIVLAFAAEAGVVRTGPLMPKLLNFDWLGSVLLSGSLVSTLLGLTRAGTLHAWSNFNIILPLQFGVIGLLAFCMWSWYSPFPSLISLDGCLHRTGFAIHFGAIVQGMIISAFLYFMPFFFNAARTDLKNAVAGVRFFPWTVPLVVMVLVTYLINRVWNCWRAAVWIGWMLTTVGIALTTLYTRQLSTIGWICIAVILGSGMGILFPSLHTASDVAASREGSTKQAVANFMFFQLLGKALGLGIAVTVFQNNFRARLKDNLLFRNLAEAYTQDSISLIVKLRVTPSANARTRVEMADVYVSSLRMIWIFLAVAAGLAFMSSFLIVSSTYEKTPQTEHEVPSDGCAV